MSASLLLLLGCFGLDNLPTQGKDSSTDDTGGSAAIGGLEIDASAIDFGAVALGATLDRDLVLTNTGASPLGVDLTINGDAFEVSTAAVRVDTDTVVTVTFAPATDGPYDGVLTVVVDDGDSLDIPLTGIGGDAPDDTGDTDDTDDPGGPLGHLTVSPTHYDFGRVDVDGDSTTTFTVTNTGDDALLISDVVTSAGVWTTGGTLRPPQVLDPGMNKLLEVTFAPGAETTYAGTITLELDDADTSEVEIAVEGEGVDLCDICSPLIDVDTGADPYAITDFFSISGFRLADDRTITVQNVGDMDLTVSSVVVNNDVFATCGAFSLSGWSSSRTLAPYASTSFTVSYLATGTCLEVAQAGIDANVLHILSNDPSQGDWVIELSGAGI